MNILTDPAFWKAIERVLLVIAGIYLGFLGYKLFLLGITTGKTASDARARVSTTIVSGVGPGLFFIVVAGLVVSVVSLTGGTQGQTAWTRAAQRVMGQASDNKAEVLNQINLLKQAKTQHQTAIRNLKGQLASAVPNNAMQPAVVTQMQESLNTATPNIDYSAVYSQMTEMNNALSELQNENDALRAENAALRAQNTSQ
jgi:regulator of replication initiation timing